MKIQLAELDLIDLISERHSLLRQKVEERWNEQSDIYIANSEWYILSRVYDNSVTIADIAKSVTISRQALHKFIRQLEQKGMIEIFNLKDNKKHKGVQLTPLGKSNYETYEAIKADIEKQICQSLGDENVKQLIALFQRNWFISQNNE